MERKNNQRYTTDYNPNERRTQNYNSQLTEREKEEKEEKKLLEKKRKEDKRQVLEIIDINCKTENIYQIF